MKTAISTILATSLLASASPLHQNMARNACPSNVDTGSTDYQVVFFYDNNCKVPAVPVITPVNTDPNIPNVNTLDSSVNCYNDWNEGHYHSFSMIAADESLLDNDMVFEFGYTNRKCSNPKPCDFSSSGAQKWPITTSNLNKCHKINVNHKNGNGNIYKVVDA